MRGAAKMNALRSAVVVLGALAFGYLTVRVGFKSFIEEAQLEQQRQEALLQSQSSAAAAAAETEVSFGDSFQSGDGANISDGSDHKL
ncbi:hypothetical protein ABFS83_07G027400 [Erythranthe nasuta]